MLKQLKKCFLKKSIPKQFYVTWISCVFFCWAEIAQNVPILDYNWPNFTSFNPATFMDTDFAGLYSCRHRKVSARIMDVGTLNLLVPEAI